MIYDTPITILKLPDDVGTPLQGALQPEFDAYCGELAVYHKRFWESVQAGSRIDMIVQMPLHRDVEADMYALYKGKVYKIEQAQFEKDENQLPITVLSMHREGQSYDIAAIS